MSWLHEVDRWKTTQPESLPLNDCFECDADIYKGDSILVYDGNCYCCTDCLIDHMLTDSIIDYEEERDTYLYDGVHYDIVDLGQQLIKEYAQIAGDDE